jgi:hypothetical protein
VTTACRSAGNREEGSFFLARRRARRYGFRSFQSAASLIFDGIESTESTTTHTSFTHRLTD